MDTGPVTYQTKSATEKDILLHLEDCDDNFTPPLSERIGLASYAKKLFERSATFEAWNEDRLVGLIAAYLSDDDTRSVFITNVSVTKEFTGKGIASRLLRNCIAHCAKNDYFVINLEVNRNNSQAIGFYEKHQFKQSGTRGDSLVLTLNLK